MFAMSTTIEICKCASGDLKKLMYMDGIILFGNLLKSNFFYNHIFIFVIPIMINVK